VSTERQCSIVRKVCDRTSVDRGLGWCYHCLNVRPVERIPPVSECHKSDRSIGARSARWIKDQWHRFIDIGDPSTRRRRQDEKIKAELQTCIAASGRKPVCLTCGSNDTEPLTHLDTFSGLQQEDVGFGFRHPGCQGELREKGSNGRLVSPVIYEQLYDVQGQKVPIHPRALEHQGPIMEDPLTPSLPEVRPIDPNSAYYQFDQIRRGIQANDT
jgi:hypothetical protein